MNKNSPKSCNKSGQKEIIFILGAHSDDFVIGAGGTIAKYAQEKKEVYSIVFSYGEKSHLWLKERFAQRMRSNEAFQASKLLGCRTLFFDLKEGRFYEDYQQKSLQQKLLHLIEQKKPVKIFTHSPDDPHPDHRDVYKITLELFEKLNSKLKPEIYTYSIWNPVSFKTKYPSFYVDVTKTYSKKLQALKLFPSQKFNAIYPLMLFIIFRAIFHGLKIRTLLAEKFYRVK